MATKHSSLIKSLAIVSLLVAIAYIIMPVDFDGPIIGLLDDFCMFMAAFCFCQSAFLGSEKIAAKKKLNIVALIFLAIGLLWLAVLALTPILSLVA